MNPQIAFLSTFFAIAMIATGTTAKKGSDLDNDDADDGQTKTVSLRIFKGRAENLDDFTKTEGFSCLVNKCGLDENMFTRFVKESLALGLTAKNKADLERKLEKLKNELEDEMHRVCCCGMSECEMTEKDLEDAKKNCKCTNWGLIIGISVGVILLIVIGIAVALAVVFFVLKRK